MTALFSGRRYGEVVIGEAFTSAMTITEAHLTLGAGLIADFNPLHVDETFARRSRYGSRILHGVITSAVLGGPVGMIFPAPRWATSSTTRASWRPCASATR